MPKKTFRLICIFFSLAILAMFYFLIYQGVMGNKLQKYLLSITKCYYLSEERCRSHAFCKAIYKPAGVGEQTFSACEYVSTSEQIFLRDTEKLCKQTGGRWEQTQYGAYCNCAANAQGGTYKPAQGCVK